MQGVTVIVGLRPYTATANILPEQTVGRGLRLMFRDQAVGYTERVDVIGNKKFIEFVEQLERDEELKLDEFEVGKDKVRIETVFPDPAKTDKDIALPQLSPALVRNGSLEAEIAALDVPAPPAPLPCTAGDANTLHAGPRYEPSLRACRVQTGGCRLRGEPRNRLTSRVPPGGGWPHTSWTLGTTPHRPRTRTRSLSRRPAPSPGPGAPARPSRPRSARPAARTCSAGSRPRPSGVGGRELGPVELRPQGRQVLPGGLARTARRGPEWARAATTFPAPSRTRCRWCRRADAFTNWSRWRKSRRASTRPAGNWAAAAGANGTVTSHRGSSRCRQWWTAARSAVAARIRRVCSSLSSVASSRHRFRSSSNTSLSVVVST